MKNPPKMIKSYLLSDFFEVKRGIRLKQSDRLPGDIPLVTAGFQNEGIAGYIAHQQEIHENAITIDMFGNSFWRPYKFSCDDNIIVLKHSLLDENTAYYFLSAIQVTTKDYNYSHQYRIKDLHKHSINIPVLVNGTFDLECIREISNVLGKTAELTAELTARKKQYGYYRDMLLSFDSCVDLIPLSEVFDVFTDFVAAGSFADAAKNVTYFSEPEYAQLVRTMDIKSNFSKGIPVYVDKKAFNFLWRVNFDEDCIVLPNIGANCGEVYYVKPSDLPYERNVLGPNAIMIKKCKYNIRFYYYVFGTSEFQKKLKKIISPGGQTKFNKTELKKILVPVPKIEKQNEIVRLLDSFSLLVESISEGLPAEIAARQKQYEYYRDKLLTFKELEA